MIRGRLAGHADVAGLVRRAGRRQIPLSLVEAPPSYPWRSEFLLVRPDQHIAWRAADPADIDLDVVTGIISRAALTACS